MGKCKNCINLDRQGWCEKAVDSPEPNRERECYYFQRMTNADRIRGMTDEELAEWLSDWTIKVMEDTETEFVLDGSFVNDAIKWLKKEVDDG